MKASLAKVRATSFLVTVGPRFRPLSSCHVRRYSAPGDRSVPATKQKYIPNDGTYPKGFLAGSAHVGVKASNTRFDDLAVIVSETPCSAAAVFTKNKFQAAPVTVSRETLKARDGQGVRAVIVNSGCANAVTGKGGLEDARTMGREMDNCLPGSLAEQLSSSLVMSTGVIGQRLPIGKIIDKIPSAVSALGTTHAHWLRTARAICTTDTFPKLLSRTFTLPSHGPGTTFSLAGMTKGAGMIHPNMATLLGIICTDAPIAASACRTALTAAIAKSFNSISIDGDTSTNDTVALLANGAAASSPSQVDATASPDDYAAFVSELTALARELAQLVVRDGEGATKFITIRVRGAAAEETGRRIASTIARSPLVKTALYGRDANWGRILCAIGYADGVPEGTVDPNRVCVSFVRTGAGAGEELRLLVNGEPQDFEEARAAEFLAEEDLEVLVRLDGDRDGEDVLFWTCDFSHEYVSINADYRT